MLKEILKALESDARMSVHQVATITDLPEDEVEKTIKKAEQEQIILKYKTIINWDKVGDEHVFALIEVKVAPQRDVGFDSIAERIYRFPQAHTVYLLSGTFYLLVIVTGKTIQEVANFVSQKLAPIEGVQSTVTHFMLKKYKEDGEILGAREELKRQPFLP
jgi:DNA-binding Lrp family transcriptional regulator